MSRKIVAYQLSLLGDEPKAGRAWERPFWQFMWSGCGFPLPDGAERQIAMLTSDSKSWEHAVLADAQRAKKEAS